MNLLSVRFFVLAFLSVVLFGCATVDDEKMAKLNKWQATAKPLRDSGKLSPLDYDKQELQIVRSEPMNHLWRIWARRLSRQIEIRTDYQNGKISKDEANARLIKAADDAIEQYQEDEKLQSQRTNNSSMPIYLPPQPTRTNCVKMGNSMNCTSY
jgi:hypothetical protein